MSGHDHAHGVSRDVRGDRRRLAVVAATMTLAAVVEVAAGRAAGSLALLSDAAHAGTDVLALLFSFYAVHIAVTRPADKQRTYGYGRAELLAALANAAILWIVAGFLVWRAYLRASSPTPTPVNTDLVGLAALVVLAAESFAFVYLWRSARTNLNVRSAFVHLAGDAVSTIAVGAGSVAIRLTGYVVIDPLVAGLIAVLIAFWALQLTRETAHILVQGVPAEMDLDEVRRDMLAVDGVEGVHDLHVWSITQGQPTLSAHVVSGTGASVEDVPARVRRMLHARYHIEHVTLQVETSRTECREKMHP